MASLIKMTSKDFVDFIDNYDYRKFNILLISQDIKTLGKYNNVFAPKTLIPPANVVSVFVSDGYCKKYVKKYMKYLTDPKVEPVLATIARLVGIENVDTVLLYSDSESQYKYIDLIGDFLEKEYSCKACSYKKFKKKREETDNSKNKKKISEILDTKIKEMELENFDIYDVSKKEFKKDLKELNKKELKAYCKANGFNYKKDWTKKEVIDNILKQKYA